MKRSHLDILLLCAVLTGLAWAARLKGGGAKAQAVQVLKAK